MCLLEIALAYVNSQIVAGNFVRGYQAWGKTLLETTLTIQMVKCQAQENTLIPPNSPVKM